MKIQFEIKEKLPEIIAEIMHSDKWQTKILEKMHGLERITIKDPNYKSEACIEIWQHEIHIRTAWSNYTYRIFTRGILIVFLRVEMPSGVNTSEPIAVYSNRSSCRLLPPK